LLHELTHWSGAETRCDRTFGERFGDDAYAMEEMVAELGAAFLCGDLGITAEPRADHADYIGHWLRILKADRKAIFTAASAANKAAEYLKSIVSNRTTRGGLGRLSTINAVLTWGRLSALFIACRASVIIR
jgi:antirestriction protein ArdC